MRRTQNKNGNRACKATPYSTAETFAQKMKATGVRCEIKGYDGAGHGFFNLKSERGKYYELTTKDFDVFLILIRFVSGECA